MREQDPFQIVKTFNCHINNGDLEGLSSLMTDDHTFIDSAGDIVPGKQEMLSVWEGFFAAYPDYQNIFQHLETKGDTVLILGYSTCSNEPTLDGPALWAAKVRDGLIAEWRVYEDTEDNRRQLGINM